ncbi:MAG: hypothetical protein ACK51L_03460, partial [bacterium]
ICFDRYWDIIYCRHTVARRSAYKMWDPPFFPPLQHHKMPTTRSRHAKHIVILCFPDSITVVVEINQGDGEDYLRGLFPIAQEIVYLPQSFSSIAKYLAHKPSGALYYQCVIKDALVEYCSKYASGFDELCTKEFSSERSAVDWCINVVIDNYISETSKLVKRRQTKAFYVSSANDAKGRWLQRRDARLLQEQYLCSKDFVLELNRSYAEFYEELKKVLGCKPFTWHSII